MPRGNGRDLSLYELELEKGAYIPGVQGSLSLTIDSEHRQGKGGISF